ncbi:MAG TPA: sigma 54-interacting transcriptional regulator [Cyclobacteriaceae bacterium]|nr:sigma 54-interacting transcriptional regulator [Cyclobacteriaceae bacterium]
MFKPEQILQLQLEVSDTLTSQTTRDGIGLALAEVINRVIPFQFFLHSIWMPGALRGYRISSTKNAEGKFEVYDDVALESFRNANFQAFVETGQFLSDPQNEGIKQGAELAALAERFPVFKIGQDQGIRSIMIFNMIHDNGARHTMVISETQENAFDPEQFKTVKTLIPQIKIAFENLLKYEQLQEEEKKKKIQLELNNVLLEHTNREDFAKALAGIVNKWVPCETFVFRVWNGPIQIGYRIPLRRQPDGHFERFSDLHVLQYAQQNIPSMIQGAQLVSGSPGIVQGPDFEKLQLDFPMARAIADDFGIKSVMILPFKVGDATCILVLGNSEPISFIPSQFELMQMLLPQIMLAFENLLKYEKLKEEEENKKLQLELNNVLLGSTNREDFGIALAEILNRFVPCERFVLRTWKGPVQLGYRLSLIRRDDERYERISEQVMVEFAEKDPEAMTSSSRFMADNPGIYQGAEHDTLCIQYPMFERGRTAFGTNSVMILPFKIEDTTGILFLGNKARESFTDIQFERISMLLPQIMLAFENVLKYENIVQAELERKAQVEILTAFNTQKDVKQMALDAIGKVNEFIPFEYWLNVTTILTVSQSQFNLSIKKDNSFDVLMGEEFFNQLGIDLIHSETFVHQNPYLFETPRLYVGDDFEMLQASVPFFRACKEKFNIRSLATFPLPTGGQVKTVVMMASTRMYAFSDIDMERLLRIIPYISMAAQQYYSLVQIQALHRQLEMEKDYLVEEIKSNYNFDEIIGTSHLMKDVFLQIGQVATTDSTVLILGETGTGKELIARALHNQSHRKSKVLVKVNCASLPSQLIESELFGHEKGSFTGALERRIGKFELANGGTIFLDEIGELPLELQAKLLRVLQEREIDRIGGKSTITLDVRIIAATNRDLETEVAEGRFRSDLYYRLNIFPIHLPPLRERKEDIPMLITHFLQKFSHRMKRPIRSLKDETLQHLMQYDWPGNIRELENVMEQYVIVGDASVTKLRKPRRAQPTSSRPQVQENDTSNDGAAIEAVFLQTKGKIIGPDGAAAILNIRPAKLEEHERRWILKCLQQCGGRVRGDNGAATMMGMKPTTLEARIIKLNITKAEIFGG